MEMDNERVVEGRIRRNADELISSYTGIFGRPVQQRQSDMFPETIVASWGSVAELWLDPTDSTEDFVIINWHDPATTLATKYAAYRGGAGLRGRCRRRPRGTACRDADAAAGRCART